MDEHTNGNGVAGVSNGTGELGQGDASPREKTANLKAAVVFAAAERLGRFTRSELAVELGADEDRVWDHIRRLQAKGRIVEVDRDQAGRITYETSDQAPPVQVVDEVLEQLELKIEQHERSARRLRQAAETLRVEL